MPDDDNFFRDALLTISRIGFGGMPLSIKGRPSEEQGRRVLHAAIDAGMTFIDTADVYCLDDSEIGHNERLIASVVRERDDRASIRIGTKAGLRRPRGAWVTDGSPKHIREACEQSLRSLDTERIWLYQFHAPDLKVPFERSVETFAELQREGKLEHFGLSNVSIEQIDQACAILPVVSVQNRLSPYFRESIGLAKECATRNITFLAYSPVGGGRLAKNFRHSECCRTSAAHMTRRCTRWRSRGCARRERRSCRFRVRVPSSMRWTAREPRRWC